MVIESLMNPKRAEKRPWALFFIGFLYASAAAFISLWVYKQYSSLVMVSLTVVAALPLVYRAFKHEERVDTLIDKETKLMIHHSKTLSFLLFMFLGFVVAFSLWYLILPSESTSILFKSQTETIYSINNAASGNYFVLDNAPEHFSIIFLNNIKVLMFCIFFAFFYGAGTIFILAWNASVIGAATGSFVKTALATDLAKFGSLGVFNYISSYSLGFFRYAIHGIPEIAAYFIGGISGGIISVAMINHDIETDKFKTIMMDALDLFMLSILVLFIAAAIEVYVTPALISGLG